MRLLLLILIFGVAAWVVFSGAKTLVRQAQQYVDTKAALRRKNPGDI